MFVIDNGMILCEPQDYTSEAYGLILNGRNCINKSILSANTNGGGTKDNPTTIIKAKSGGIIR